MTDLLKTDLIINPDGSIFHLYLKPGEIANDIILVGDPGRVRQVSKFFGKIEIIKENREFVTHTGTFRGHRISVISTGIGTDNIDIVLTELDALVNVDLQNLVIKDKHHKLNLIRLGTSGLLDPDISPGSIVMSEISGGLDGTIHFYRNADHILLSDLSDRFISHFSWIRNLSQPYFVEVSDSLRRLFQSPGITSGITLSAPGFYGPQFRKLRLEPFLDDFFDRVVTFRYQNLKITNFEMESSLLYGLSNLLGHDAITLCVGIANRLTNDVVKDYKIYVDRLIEYVLNKLTGQNHE